MTGVLGSKKVWGRALLASAGLAVAFGGWTAYRTPADAAEDGSALAPVRAAALVEATSGAASTQLAAEGAKAKLINASMPFAASPIAAAAPFVISGGAVGENRALLCLTQAVYYEAGYEPLAGRRAVAQVVLNRLRHPAFPKSICGVVYQRSASRVCQFTFACDGALDRAPEAGAWRQARAIAQAALAGHVERSVGSSTHYHADYVAPRWAPMLAKVAQIGAHIFYRWPGAWGQPRAFTGRYIGEPADPAALRPPQLAVEVDGAPPEMVVAEAGPPVRRAPTDVGGLLDTSKGWSLSIPDPRETRSAAARVIAAQQQPTPAAPVAPVAVAAVSAPVDAGR